MRYFLALALLALTSCASLNNAGTASYSIKPFNGVNGVTCCEVEIKNGKEIGHLKVRAEKHADGSYFIDLEERNVKAFTGQAIAAQAVGGAVDNVAGAVSTRAITGAAGKVIPGVIGAIAK